MSTAATPDPNSESGQIQSMREAMRKKSAEIEVAADDVCKSKRLIVRTIQESGKAKLPARDKK